ncbi:hypothetical protein LO763_14375 [Glycomyces sp. A-F 0318]|uniref:hypothetical protein n=1 Tax=Glycomyces amatae TaxID=2881355 RepID=UPI001E5F12FB|nr:hypothetical protein [Glycomyces amatae]MCD0444802.1 hypothetical protein [Glycomyces amatae]
MSTDTSASPSDRTKIGTEVFGVRVVSGSVDRPEPGSVTLRQLYPGAPTDIGVIDTIEGGTGAVTIYPSHRREWTDRDRARLAEFFVRRYLDRARRTTDDSTVPGVPHEHR